MPVLHDTFALERSYPASPSRVFQAFADPAQKRRWFAEGGASHTLEAFEMDFRPGGLERFESRFTDASPFPGVLFLTLGTYLDIEPDSRIVLASSMTIGERCISASLLTTEIFPSHSGARLLLTHQAAYFAGSDGPELRQDGWIKILDRFAAALES